MRKAYLLKLGNPFYKSLGPSRNRLKVFDFWNPLPQLLLDSHDNCHDHTRAAAPGAMQPHPDDAVTNVEQFDITSIHLQRRTDLGGKDTSHPSLDRKSTLLNSSHRL